MPGAAIATDSVALAWREIARLHAPAKKRGYESKIPAAVLLAQRFNCEGCVLVCDRDRNEDRSEGLQTGLGWARDLFPDFPMVLGLAFESVEAWTLGVPESIALVLEIDVKQARADYPTIQVESMYEQSGKVEHQPKKLLERIVRLKHWEDSTAFREVVAEITDIAALEKACPLGFGPFAKELRSVFGS